MLQITIHFQSGEAAAFVSGQCTGFCWQVRLEQTPPRHFLRQNTGLRRGAVLSGWYVYVYEYQCVYASVFFHTRKTADTPAYKKKQKDWPG